MRKGFLASAWKTNKGGSSSNPLTKPENQNNNSHSHHQTNNPNNDSVSALVEVAERDAKVDFTHVRCLTQITRLVSKQAMEKGVVVVRCSSCDDLIPVADHAQLFGDGAHDKMEKYFGGVTVPDKGSDFSYCATFRTQDWFSRKTAEMKENNMNTQEHVSKEEEEEDLEKALIKKGNTTPQALLKLPLDIFLKIISLLSIKPLAVSRSVCKTWLQIISHPSFIELHQPPEPILLFQFGGNHLLMQEDKVPVPLTFTDPDLKFMMVGSMKGLLCLADGDTNDPIYVCNPVIGEYFMLPKVGRDGRFTTICGFGFDELSNKYKVVRLISYLDHNVFATMLESKLEAEVYTLGSGKWRKLGDVPYPLHGSLTHLRKLVNGAFHWLKCYDNESVLIVAFHLGREEFLEVPPPPTPRLNGTFWDKKSLGNLKGSLCLLDYTSGFDCVVWLMKDYGVAGSWMKKDVVSQNIDPGVPLSFTLIGVQSDDTLVLLVDSRWLVYYDPATKIAKKFFPFVGDEKRFDVLLHHRCFVSLQDIVEPTNSKSKSKTGRWYGEFFPISTTFVQQPEEMKTKQSVEDFFMKMDSLLALMENHQ